MLSTANCLSTVEGDRDRENEVVSEGSASGCGGRECVVVDRRRGHVVCSLQAVVTQFAGEKCEVLYDGNVLRCGLRLCCREHCSE